MAAASAPPCLVSLSVLSRCHGGAAGSDWQSGLAKWSGADRASACASGRGDSTSFARTASRDGRDPSLASSYKPLAVDKQSGAVATQASYWTRRGLDGRSY